MPHGTAQTAIQIMALVIGGGFTLFWTILNFFILRQRRKAAGDLQQVELNIKNIEFQLRRTVCVRVDISATSLRRPDGPGYCIIAAVILTNTGNKVTQIKWLIFTECVGPAECALQAVSRRGGSWKLLRRRGLLSDLIAGILVGLIGHQRRIPVPVRTVTKAAASRAVTSEGRTKRCNRRSCIRNTLSARRTSAGR